MLVINNRKFTENGKNYTGYGIEFTSKNQLFIRLSFDLNIKFIPRLTIKKTEKYKALDIYWLFFQMVILKNKR